MKVLASLSSVDVDFVTVDGAELVVLMLKIVDVRLARAEKVVMIIMTNASNRFILYQVMKGGRTKGRRFFVKLYLLESYK